LECVRNCVQHLPLVLYVIFFSCLPLIAWTNRAVWDALVAEEFSICRQECYKVKGAEEPNLNEKEQNIMLAWASKVKGAEEPSEKVQKIMGDWKTRRLCNLSFPEKEYPDGPPQYGSEWDEAFLLRNITKFFGNYEDMHTSIKHPRDTCNRVLQVAPSTYIKQMVKTGNIFSAFDSRLRTARQIGILEVYGAPLAVAFYIAMFSSRLALRTKLRTLSSAKRELILSSFLPTEEDGMKYKKLFDRLHVMLTNKSVKDKSDIWVTQVLQKGIGIDRKKITMDAGGKQKDWKKTVFEVGEDLDEDGRTDAKEGYCDGLLAWIVAFVFSLGHVAIPGLCREYNIVGSGQEGFFGTEELKPAVILNMLVCFVFNYLWFSRFVTTFHGQEEKFQTAIAFDCMWRFPNENPIKTTMREETPLMDEVEEWKGKDSEGDVEKATGGEPFFDEGYRANFSKDKRDHLLDEVNKLEEWYEMRHYLQIDKFDECISIELAMLVALWTLVPEICVISGNFFMLDRKVSSLQAVNFVTLWDFCFILYYVFRALMITLAFNDLYDRHKDNLRELRDYIQLEIAKAHNNPQANTLWASWGLTNQGDVNADPNNEAQNPGTKAINLVDTYINALDRFDAPSSFFGLTVDRKVITGFSSTVLIFFAPQIISIIQDFCKDF